MIIINAVVFLLLAVYLSTQDSWVDFITGIPIWVRIILLLVCVCGSIWELVKNNEKRTK